MKIDKIEYRAVIKYLFLKGNTPTQIKDELDSVYGDSAPSFTTVKVHEMVLDDRRIKVRDSRGYEHVKRTCLSHIKSTFRHEKAVRPKMCSNEDFQSSVGAV